MVRLILIALALTLTACGTTARPLAEQEAFTRGMAAIEQGVGGRVGVALVDGRGRSLLAHRATERFAMCSTFKLPLAAAILESADRGRLRLTEPLAFTRADLVSHAPAVEAAIAGGSLPIDRLAEAIMVVSDNAAANLLLRRIGGPDALTAFFRRHGDTVSRLDRYETKLNENRVGDPRDTTSPAAMAALVRRLLVGDALAVPSRERLFGWAEASRTGLQRIRAGLPPGWRVGDKTGSCGNAFNDVAIAQPPGAKPFVLAVYVDRPTAPPTEVNAAIADIGRLAAEAIARR